MLETTTELPKMDLEVINTQMSIGINRVNEVLKLTEELKEKSLTIKINGDDDKVGYLATKEFLGEVRKIRTGLEKERQACVKPLNNIVDWANGQYKFVGKILAEIEAPGKQQKEEYEASEENRKAQEAAAKEKVITDKIALILEVGFEYNAINGYYRNSGDRAITRMDITNMSSEDFENFLSVVKVDFEAAQEKVKEQIALEEKVKSRKVELWALSLPMIGTDYSITDTETEDVTNLSGEDIESLDDTAFGIARDKLVSVAYKNKAYLKSIKDKQEKDAQELKDRQAELDLKETNLKLKQIEMFRVRLFEFSFTQMSKLDDSFFLYKGSTFEIRTTVGELLENEGALELAEKWLKDRKEDDAVAEKKKIEDDTLEDNKKLLEKQEKEAKTKRVSKKELAIIDPSVSEIFGQIAELKKAKFELIGDYAETFMNSIDAAIDKLNQDLRHLR